MFCGVDYDMVKLRRLPFFVGKFGWRWQALGTMGSGGHGGDGAKGETAAQIISCRNEAILTLTAIGLRRFRLLRGVDEHRPWKNQGVAQAFCVSSSWTRFENVSM